MWDVALLTQVPPLCQCSPPLGLVPLLLRASNGCVPLASRGSSGRPQPRAPTHVPPPGPPRSILPGQRKRMLQDERHTTAMLRFAGLKPPERKQYLTGAGGLAALDTLSG